jgi:hypothetical protein
MHSEREQRDVGDEETDCGRPKSYRHIVHTKINQENRYKRLKRVLSDKEQKVESSSLESRYLWL